MKKNLSKTYIERLFPREINSSSLIQASRLDTFVYISLPFLIMAYFISLGIATGLDSFFGILILLLGLSVLIQKRYITAPFSIKFIYYIGLALSVMVILHALVASNTQMLFKFQFQNMRNMLVLPLIAILLSVARFDAQGVWRIIVLSGLYSTFLVLIILIYEPARGEGVLSEAIVVGNIGMLFGLLSLVALFGLQGKRWKALALLAFMSGVLLSVLSQTRAGWVAFVISVFFLMWVLWSVNRKMFFYFFITGGIFVGALLFFWNSLPFEARFFQAINDVEQYFNGNSNTSVGARLDMWKVALHAFTEKPFFGWGVLPFKEVFVDYVNQGTVNFRLVDGSDGFAQPHNDYMFLLYHFGLFGFGLAMMLLLYPAYLLIKVISFSKLEKNNETVFLALTGLISIEALLDFMLFNLAFMNEIFYVVVVVVMMVLFALHFRNGRIV